MQEYHAHFTATSQIKRTKHPLMYCSLLLLASLAMLSALTFQPTPIAHAASTSQPQVHYLVVTLNSSGQPTEVTSVTQTTFLKLRAQGMAKAQLMPHHATPLINRVSDTDCATRTDFWKLWNNTTIAGGVCFANNGTININVFNVFEVDTGNNSGNFVAATNVHFPGDGLQYCAMDDLVFFDSLGNQIVFSDITQVTIVGRTTSPCDM